MGKRSTIWAGESDQKCNVPMCSNTAENFALHWRKGRGYICVVCLIALYRDTR